MYIFQKTVVEWPSIVLSYTMLITFGSPLCIMRNSLVNVKSVSGVAVFSFFLFLTCLYTQRVIHLKVT